MPNSINRRDIFCIGKPEWPPSTFSFKPNYETHSPPLFLPERDQTPLFFPDSRGPTPFPQDPHAETPTFFPPLPRPNIQRREETPLFSSFLLPPPRPDDTTSPDPSRPTTPEPPGKKRRVESGPDAAPSPATTRVHQFLDISAEDEDEDQEEEDEEEEETLSDREFLDDEPLHEDREDEDDLRALAALYQHAGPAYQRAADREQNVALPISPASTPTVNAPLAIADDTHVPETWVIPRSGIYKHKLALVLTKKKLLVAPLAESIPTIGMGLMVHQAPLKYEISRWWSSRPPTKFYLSWKMTTPNSKNSGLQGIAQLSLKIIESYNGIASFKKGDPGLYVQLADLERHGLDLPCAIRVHDRVHVVSGVLYRGATGRVLDNSDGILTIAAPSNAEIVGPTTQHCREKRQSDRLPKSP
ncbi:hypothetical protein B0H14DRAFT_2646497 [Mycena olivaceomarginata]|nr:hypothetical protein B0H14DRAFT_2646497 [Mycena olivaceomarginata]